MLLLVPAAILTGGLTFLVVFLLFVPADPDALMTAHELEHSPYGVLRALGYALDLAVRLDLLLSGVYLALFPLVVSLAPLWFVVFVWHLVRS